MSTHLLVGGKRNSGKSTFACSLFLALRVEGFTAELLELDPYSDSCDCILGLKPWEMRRKVAEPPREEFLRRSEQFRSTRNVDFVIGDLPGRIHAKNRLLIDGADGAIFVDRATMPGDQPHDPAKAEWDTNHHDPDIDAWQTHFADAGVPIILRVYSLKQNETPPEANGFPFPTTCVSGLENRSAICSQEIRLLAQELRQITRRISV